MSEVLQVEQQSPLLGRNLNHDDRSRAFPMRAAEVVDRSQWRDKRVRLYSPLPNPNQPVGCCTGVAKAMQFNAIGNRKMGQVLDMDDALSIYSRASTLDPWSGSWPPTDTGSSGLASAKAAQQLGLGGEYRWIFGGADGGRRDAGDHGEHHGEGVLPVGTEMIILAVMGVVKEFSKAVLAPLGALGANTPLGWVNGVLGLLPGAVRGLAPVVAGMVAPLGPGRGVEAHGGGGAHVEGLRPAVHRHGDAVVGQRLLLLRQSPGLVAEEPRGGAGQQRVGVHCALECDHLVRLRAGRVSR